MELFLNFCESEVTVKRTLMGEMGRGADLATEISSTPGVSLEVNIVRRWCRISTPPLREVDIMLFACESIWLLRALVRLRLCV